VEGVLTGVKAAITLALLFAPSVARADTSLTVGNAPGYPGTTATMPVYLAQGSNVVVSQFDVAYNAARVVPAGAAQAPRIAGQRVKYRDIAPGVRRVLAYSTSPATSRFTNAARTVAVLPFTLGPGQYSGSGPVTPANAIFVQKDETSVPGAALNSGAIFAQPVFLQSDGTPSFFLPSQPGSNYVIQASADLAQWVNLSTNRATSDFIESSDPGGRELDHRFYRLEPNP